MIEKFFQYLDDLNVKYKFGIHSIEDKQIWCNEILVILKKEIHNGTDMPFILIFPNYECTGSYPCIIFEKEIQENEKNEIKELWDKLMEEEEGKIESRTLEGEIVCFTFCELYEDVFKLDLEKDIIRI